MGRIEQMVSNGVVCFNGPNLNMLGKRDPAKYGTQTLEDISEELRVVANREGFGMATYQSNAEHELIDWFHQMASASWVAGIVLNAGGLTHTSVILRDAVEIARDCGVPTVEVHLSDIHTRESFRHASLLSAAPTVVIGTFCGKKAQSYVDGLIALIDHVRVHPRE